MRIKRVTIRNMYGSYSTDVSFKPDVNILVGINGSGKTTVLNCIDWVFRLDLASLSTVQFDEIAIQFQHDGKPYSLEVTQGKDFLSITESKSGRFTHPITVKFAIHPSQVNDDRLLKDLVDHYRAMTPDRDERPLWSFISEMPAPLSVSLERTISTEIDDTIYFDAQNKARNPKDRKLRSGLDKVKDVMRMRYSAYRASIHSLNEELKTSLVISAFRTPVSILSTKTQTSKDISLQDVARLEKRVTTILGASLGSESASHHIAAFFANAKEFAKHAKEVRA